jgi:hypothetical protein
VSNARAAVDHLRATPRVVRRGALELIREQWADDGRLELVDRLAAIARVDYIAQWRRELRAGADGQRLDAPGTWRLDGLWRAACWQLRAEATQRLLSDAAEFSAIPSFLSALIDDVEADWASAHHAYRTERGADVVDGRETEPSPRSDAKPTPRRRRASSHRRRAWEINLERGLRVIP